MGASLDAGWKMCADLEAAGAPLATCDPRSATPPCLLIEPPSGNYEACSLAGEWRVVALASATANTDAWSALDDLEAVVWQVLPVERRTFGRYVLAADAPAMPAYLFTFTQGVDLE
jgi:hypothetical protein